MFARGHWCRDNSIGRGWMKELSLKLEIRGNGVKRMRLRAS